jgi:Putative Actinobacterial Holin-X, holin superfamily III
MPEADRSELLKKLVKFILREALGGAAKPIEGFIKGLVRSIGMILAGIVIALIGVGFVAVGAVKWLSALMPSWLAWGIVGIVLLLIGVSVTMTTLASSRR